MNIEGLRIWQVAAGDSARSYANICLDWDVVLEPPSDRDGPWPNWLSPEGDPGPTGAEPPASVRQSDQLTEGDIVVLRVGREPAGVGRVAGVPFTHEEFGDIDGRGMSRVWRVRWLWKRDENLTVNAKYTFAPGPAIQPLNSESVLSWLTELVIDPRAFERPLTELPTPEGPVAWPEIEDSLFHQGLTEAAIRGLAKARAAICHLAQWHHQTATPTSQAEAATNLITPLLRGLGWSAQQLGIQWNNVGVAAYATPNRRDEQLAMAVEIRHGLLSCQSSSSQARFYAEVLRPSERCNRLVVTDGIRYGIFLRKGNQTFPETPTAYLNLSRMRTAYSVLGCSGAKEALLMLLPDRPEQISPP